MNRVFPLLILTMGLFLSACIGNTSINSKPIEAQIPIDTARASDDKPTKDKPKAEDIKISNDPQTLYDQKQYDNALMAILEADPRLLEDLSTRKLLWRINDRLVTAQWYLQKSIVELLNGHQDKARYHLDQALKLYPHHKPSLLLKQKLDSIDFKKPHKTPKKRKPLEKKEKTGKGPAKEELTLAEYYLMAGTAYFEEGQLTLAKASWLSGLNIVPSHQIIKKKLVKLLTNEGLQLFGQGDIEASIEKWDEALKINPDDPETKGTLTKPVKPKKKPAPLIKLYFGHPKILY